MTIGVGSTLFRQFLDSHTLKMKSVLIKFNSRHARKLKTKNTVSLFSKRFQILECGRRAVFLFWKRRKFLPIPVRFLRNGSVTTQTTRLLPKTRATTYLFYYYCFCSVDKFIMTIGDGSSLFRQFLASHTLKMKSVLNKFNSRHARKLKTKITVSLFSKRFQILECGRRAVLSSFWKRRKFLPIPVRILRNGSVTIVAAQSLQFGMVFQQ